MSRGIKERYKMRMNLINAEIYANCPELVKGVSSPRSPSRYDELKEVRDADGVHYQTVKEDYPITAEYVNSFADAANYKKDIVSAISSPSKKNLGDISSLQEVLQKDNSDIIKELDELKAKLIAAQDKDKELTKAEPEKEPAKVVENGGSN